MAGAPDDEQKERADRPDDGATLGARLRRLAWFGWLAIGLATLAVAGLLFWLAGQSGFDGRDTPDVAPDVAAASPSRTSGSPLPTDRDSLPSNVRRYLEETVYPPGTGPLTRGNTDLLEPNRRFEDFRPIAETFSMDANEVVSVRLTSDRYYYEGDDPIEIRLALRRGESTIEALSLDAGATREGRGGLEGSRMALRFTPDADSSEADAGYVARLDPARFSDHHGPVVIDARIEYAPGVVHEETMRLFITPEGRIPARFTGDVEDEIVNGSLRVLVGIEVEQAGQYRVDANLYDAGGRPVAFSAFKGRLSRSDRQVPIDFFGRILRDANARGPFRVGEVRGYRFLDGDYPDRERIPNLGRQHVTRAYDATRFSNDEFVSAHKLQMVRLLMEDARRGIAIDAPPIPSEGQPDPGASAPAPQSGPAPPSRPGTGS